MVMTSREKQKTNKKTSLTDGGESGGGVKEPWGGGVYGICISTKRGHGENKHNLNHLFCSGPKKKNKPKNKDPQVERYYKIYFCNINHKSVNRTQGLNRMPYRPIFVQAKV